MKTYSSKVFKQEMGLQLGLIRRQLKKPIELVAEETHLHPMTIDYIEMGESVSWKKYFQLVGYYGCKIKFIVSDKA